MFGLKSLFARICAADFWKKDVPLYGLMIGMVVGGMGIGIFLYLLPALFVIIPTIVALPVTLFWGWQAGVVAFFVSMWLWAILYGLPNFFNELSDIRSYRQFDSQIAANQYSRSRPHERSIHCPCWNCKNPDKDWADEPTEWPAEWMAATGQTFSNVFARAGNLGLRIFGWSNKVSPFKPGKHIVG